MAERLLLFVTDLKRGGTPLVVKRLALGLRHCGHEVEVACLDRMGEVGEELVAEGVKVHALGARGVWDWGVALRFRRLVREGNFGRVVSFLVHANAVAAWASRGVEGVRWFQSVQTTQPKPAWHWRVQRWAARAAERVIVPSEAAATACIERSGIARERIVVVPNAVDAGRFSGLGATGGKRVVFLGRLDPVKRIGDLIAAATLLGAEYEVRIYGEGEERDRLTRLASAARAKGANVELCGGVPWAREALEGANVLVLPSEAEGFGLVLIEAMAAGVAVVASRAPGITDVVRDGETGLLFDVGDVGGLATAVRRVCSDADLRARLTRTATAHVREVYSEASILKGWERALLLPDL